MKHFLTLTAAIRKDSLRLFISQHVILIFYLIIVIFYQKHKVFIFALKKSSQRITDIHLDIHIDHL